MRLLFVCKSYWPVPGGIERHVATLAEELAAEHEVTVLALRTTARRDSPLDGNLWPCPRFVPYEHAGVHVRQLRPEPVRSVRYLPFALRVVPLARRMLERRGRLALVPLFVPALRRAIEPVARQSDVVHVFGDEFLALAGVEAARSVGRPVVANGFVHEHAWGDDLVSQRAYRQANLVVANRPEDAAQYRVLGVAPERVRICGEGVPPPGPARTPVHPAYRPDQPLVLFLGRRVPYKGAGLLLEAARRLATTHPRAQVAFVGPGPRLRTGASNIVDVGQVSDAERDDWLARADMLCLPSAHETFGLCLLEAWARGVPVVVSDIKVLVNLIRDSGGGVAVARDPTTLATAIGALLDDPARRRELGTAGQSFWQTGYTATAYAKRHLEAYHQLVQLATANAQ